MSGRLVTGRVADAVSPRDRPSDPSEGVLFTPLWGVTRAHHICKSVRVGRPRTVFGSPKEHMSATKKTFSFLRRPSPFYDLSLLTPQ